MSSDMSLHWDDKYKLIQSTFTYFGECKICLEEDREIFSLHQVASEIYEEELHGPIERFGHLQGVGKMIEISKGSEDGVTSTAISIIHQVSLCTDGKIRVFSPMHGACSRCINTIKKMEEIRCHICRLDLSIDKFCCDTLSFPVLTLSSSESRYTQARMPLSFELPARSLDLELDEEEVRFRHLSHSERRDLVRNSRPFFSLAERGAAMVEAQFRTPYFLGARRSNWEELESIDFEHEE